LACRWLALPVYLLLLLRQWKQPLTQKSKLVLARSKWKQLPVGDKSEPADKLEPADKPEPVVEQTAE
jgi:hypothetical protein